MELFFYNIIDILPFFGSPFNAELIIQTKFMD